MEYMLYRSRAGVPVPTELSPRAKRKMVKRFKEIGVPFSLKPDDLAARESRRPSLIQISPMHVRVRIPASVGDATAHFREGTSLPREKGWQWTIPAQSQNTHLLFSKIEGQKRLVGVLVPVSSQRRLPFFR